MPEDEVNLRVQVEFQIEQEEDWPPVSSERLWAIPIGINLVRIDNAPWFVQDVSLDDIVETRTSPDGTLEAVRKVTWSGNCTVRIIPYKTGRFSGDAQRIIDVFSPLGVHAEGIKQFGMISLTVPPSADIPEVKGLLVQGFNSGWWDYEESCIGNKWADASPR